MVPLPWAGIYAALNDDTKKLLDDFISAHYYRTGMHDGEPGEVKVKPSQYRDVIAAAFFLGAAGQIENDNDESTQPQATS